ncbi:deazapurine DNA modification protein DpdA family protein, partial [Streptomyces diastatochromogenes]|uniref:deazapurine DNA modification protein DpdA family protein n=1 Tax=Streptomyces diastatochromogenes TaxID=42236 RepID=UPI00367D81AB
AARPPPPAPAPPPPGPPRMKFYLTTHKRHWIKLTDKPLFLKSEHFVSAAKLYPALGPYAVDSGGFGELQHRGDWTRTPRQYVQDLRRIWECVGPYDWAAPQDWMCEEAIIEGGWFGGQYFVGTHLSVAEHQRRTVANFLELRSLAPDLRIVPVLQGREVEDYERCVELYDKAGVDLRAEPVVGLGSVCRLQSTKKGAAIVTAMAAHGFKLHGFGFKILGLERVGHLLASADSAAWSSHARRRPPLPGHTHKNCANCLDYALKWRQRVVNAIPTHRQTLLTDRSAA